MCSWLCSHYVVDVVCNHLHHTHALSKQTQNTNMNNSFILADTRQHLISDVHVTFLKPIWIAHLASTVESSSLKTV